jgi:ATP-dependent Lhr-like helicase
VNPDAVERAAAQISGETGILKGRFRPQDIPGGHEPQWAFKPTIERIHRKTLHILRKEIQPCSFVEFTRFIQHWQHVSTADRLRGAEGLQQCLEQLEGLSLPADVWVRDVLWARVEDLDLTALDQMTSGGAVVWAGTGPGKMMILSRGSGGIFLPPAESAGSNAPGESAKRVLEYIRNNGASFLGDIRNDTRLSLHALNRAIADLFWSGRITNDVFTETMRVRKPTRSRTENPAEPVQLLAPHRNPGRTRLVQTVRKAIRQSPGWKGRWSLLRSPAVMGDELPLEQQAAAQASQMLERYGILARELYRREDLLPWPVIASELQRMEMRGEIRRGYFVQGLSGMQYALPTAVETLRRLRAEPEETEPETIVLSACDPGTPYGPGIQPPLQVEPGEAPRFVRQPSNFLAFRDGRPLLYIESYGSRVWTLGSRDSAALKAGATHLKTLLNRPSPLRSIRTITIEHIDGERAARSPCARLFSADGFNKGPDQTLTYDGYS